MLAIVELGELAIIAAEPSADGEHPLKCRKRAMRLCCEAQLAQSMNQAPVVQTHRSPVAPTSAVRHGQQSLPPRLLCCSASGDLVGNYISTPSWRRSMGKQTPCDVRCWPAHAAMRVWGAVGRVEARCWRCMLVRPMQYWIRHAPFHLTSWSLPHCSSTSHCPF